MTLSDNARQLACLGAAGFLGVMLLVAATAAPPVHAKVPIEVVAQKQPLTTRVSYGDLRLQTREGRSILYHRVGAAVEFVCPPTDEDGFEYMVQDCKDYAWNGARPQIHRAIRLAKTSSVTLAMAIEITAAQK